LLSVVIGGGTGNPWLDDLTRWLLSLSPGASQLSRIAVVLAIFGITIIVRGIIIRKRDLLLADLQFNFVESQRLKIMELLASSRWDLTARLRHGRIMHVLGGDVLASGEAASFLLRGTISFTLLIGQLLLMFLLSPGLAGLLCVLMLAGAVGMGSRLLRAKDVGRGLTNANLQLMTSTGQFLGGLKLAVSQGLQASFLEGFRTTLAAAVHRRVAFVDQRTGTQLIVTSAGAFIASIVILAGIGAFDARPATLLGFLFVMSRMIAPLTQIYLGGQHVFHSLPAYGKIKELQHELASAPADWPGGAGEGGSSIGDGVISFDDVSFSHGHGGDAINTSGVQGISLRLEPGSFVGLAGASGSGKTTFCDLVVGLYPPNSGRISVGGNPLEGPTLPEWRACVSYVSQDPFLFHDTIRANLLWGCPEASEQDVWAALELAGADVFVRKLEHGLDTVVGERGSLVSGGERQRLALARALLRRPKLLVLDEATNAIDIAGERDLLNRLSLLPDRPTIIMVAHREESLAFCERIIELRAGRVVLDRSTVQ
jgi:ATP-binding cassette subfamily C protein